MAKAIIEVGSDVFLGHKSKLSRVSSGGGNHFFAGVVLKHLHKLGGREVLFKEGLLVAEIFAGQVLLELLLRHKRLDELLLKHTEILFKLSCVKNSGFEKRGV